MPQNVASDLDPHCLHMFHKKDARLIWVKVFALSLSYLNQALYKIQQLQTALPQAPGSPSLSWLSLAQNLS